MSGAGSWTDWWTDKTLSNQASKGAAFVSRTSKQTQPGYHCLTCSHQLLSFFSEAIYFKLITNKLHSSISGHHWGYYRICTWINFLEALWRLKEWVRMLARREASITQVGSRHQQVPDPESVAAIGWWNLRTHGTWDPGTLGPWGCASRHLAGLGSGWLLSWFTAWSLCPQHCCLVYIASSGLSQGHHILS